MGATSLTPPPGSPEAGNKDVVYEVLKPLYGSPSEVGPVSLLDQQSRNWQSRLSHGTFEELVSFSFI